MCQLLFLASDHALPEVPWNAEARAFHIRQATPAEHAVRAHLTKEHIYYVGSHEGCGCGFSVTEMPIEDQVDQWIHDASVQNVVALRDYLRENLGPFAAVEIYVAWNGNLKRKPRNRRLVAVAEISETTFSAEEPILVRISARGSRPTLHYLQAIVIGAAATPSAVDSRVPLPRLSCITLAG